MKLRLIYLIVLQLFLTSCAIHKIDIQQGNILTAADVAQIKPGMTREQVKYLLGNPAIEYPFDHNRWDYPFSFQSGKKGDSGKQEAPKGNYLLIRGNEQIHFGFVPF